MALPTSLRGWEFRANKRLLSVGLDMAAAATAGLDDTWFGDREWGNFLSQRYRGSLKRDRQSDTICVSGLWNSQHSFKKNDSSYIRGLGYLCNQRVYRLSVWEFAERDTKIIITLNHNCNIHLLIFLKKVPQCQGAGKNG